jgi:guanylate kinase
VRVTLTVDKNNNENKLHVVNSFFSKEVAEQKIEEYLENMLEVTEEFLSSDLNCRMKEFNERRNGKMNEKKIYNKQLFCILGETCSGKDTTVRNAIRLSGGSFKAVCSYTTRPKRDNEVEGREHYFVTKEEFAKLKKEKEDDVIAYTKIGEFEYMALIDELEKSNIYIIDPLGFEDLKRRFGDRIPHIIPIYITASLLQRMERGSHRSDFDTAFRKRVISETEQFTNFVLDNRENGFHVIDTGIMTPNEASQTLYNMMSSVIKRYK